MKYDVVGVGNALVDVVVEVPDKTLDEFDLEKGTMHLVSHEESEYILKNVRKHKNHISSGGGIANSIYNLATLGNKTALVGVVGNDSFGKYILDDLEKTSVASYVHTINGDHTGHAITLITPDGERTFATHIGAAEKLSKKMIDEEVIKKTKILYLEGYLLDSQSAQGAALFASKLASENNVDVAIDMSNISIVRKHHKILRELIEKYATVCFANEDEARAYTGKDAVEALDEIAGVCEIAVVTQSEKGSLIKSGDMVYEIAGVPAETFVNTNGAGDMYAAGILRGIVSGLSLERAGEIASFLAACVVSHHDARLEQKYVKNQYKKCLASS